MRRDGGLDYGWARLDSCSYRMHCNEKDTTGSILAVSNICSLYMRGSHNDCNSSAICGLSCSSWEATQVSRYIRINVIVHINVLCMIPEQYIQVLGISKLGVCEFFSLLFILYELVSILKNMTLCGLPVPTKIKIWIQKFLDDMTEELPEEAAQKLHDSEGEL